MKAPVFTGTCTALITPFRSDGAIDYPAFSRQIHRQLAAGIDALCVCGTTGEGSTLTDQEHQQMVSFCVEEVEGRCPVIAGAGSNDTRHALALCQGAQDAGADALLLVTPYYNKTTQTGLIRHYEFLADRVEVPILLYNVPSRTGLSFTAETYAALSRHPNINGIKEASGNFTLAAETLAACGGEMNLWSGNDDQALPLLALGGKGLISVAANLIPSPMAELTHAFQAGDLDRARTLQLTLLPIIQALFLQVNPIPIKTAMALAGLDSGALRLPLCPMDQEPKKALIAELEKLGM
jgi:4-hydroxy-tetrahydrodipicolinate synthase